MLLRSSLRVKPFWVFSQNSPTPVFYPKATVTTGDREFSRMGDFRSVPVDPAYKYKQGWYLKVVTICLDGLCKTKLQVVRQVYQACHKMPLLLATVASWLLVRARGIDWGRGQRGLLKPGKETQELAGDHKSSVFRCGIETVLRSWGVLTLPNFQLLIQLEWLHVAHTPTNGQVSFCLSKTEIINYLIVLLHAYSL